MWLSRSPFAWTIYSYVGYTSLLIFSHLCPSTRYSPWIFTFFKTHVTLEKRQRWDRLALLFEAERCWWLFVHLIFRVSWQLKSTSNLVGLETTSSCLLIYLLFEIVHFTSCPRIALLVLNSLWCPPDVRLFTGVRVNVSVVLSVFCCHSEFMLLWSDKQNLWSF